MIDFFNRFLRPAPPSGATAKERSRLVLLSDHLSLAPEVIEALKRDLLLVISKYVEIDRAHADVTFEHRAGEVAMLASIPITGVRERTREEVPESALVASAPATAHEARAEPADESLSVADATATAAPPAAALAGTAAPTPAPTTPRRRRRRKASAAKRAAQQQAMTLGNPAQA